MKKIDLTTRQGFDALDASVKAIADNQYQGNFNYLVLAYDAEKGEHLSCLNAGYGEMAYMLTKALEKSDGLRDIMEMTLHKFKSESFEDDLDKRVQYLVETMDPNTDGLIYSRSTGETYSSYTSGDAERIEMMLLGFAAQGQQFEEVLIRAATRIVLSRQEFANRAEKTGVN
jgi:hypothetical protein